MKRLLYLFIISLMVVSCVDVNEDNTNIKIINLSVKSTDWVRYPNQGNFEYYSVAFNMPEINNWVYNNGVINAYRTHVSYAQQLPTVIHKKNNLNQLWTETVDYQYEPGRVIIYVTSSDFTDERPENMTFKVSLVW